MKNRLLVTVPLLLASWLTKHASAQPLEYTTTWIGNTFGDGKKWAQNSIENLFVTPDGTVFTASPWDEGGREFGIYKEGDVLGRCADTHGWGTGGGHAVTATDKYIFIAHTHGNENGALQGEKYPPKGFTWYGVSRFFRDGRHAPFPGGRGRHGDMLILQSLPTSAHIRGLATDGKQLFVSETAGGMISAYDPETMERKTGCFLASPGPLAWDARGALWVLHGRPARLSSVPASLNLSNEKGEPLPAALRASQLSFPMGVVATALAVDARGRLLVADNGPAQNIGLYELEAVTGTNQLKRVGAFGEERGLYGGAVPGATGPLRFAGPMGVGVDGKETIYVGCTQPAGGSLLRAFTPDGALRWELLGLEFVDTADAAPGSDGADVYTTENRYTCDWSQPAGRQWTWRAQTVDPFRYLHDPRLHEGHHDFCAPLVRTLDGRRFLVVRGMFQQCLVFYAFEGEIARPAAMFAKSNYRHGDWRKLPQPVNSRWLWRDTNGDGDFQSDEFFDADGVNDPESWAWWVDEAGGVWQGDQTGANPIRHFPLQGFDARGNPVYTRAGAKVFALPAPMNHLLRLEYLSATDTMYLTGHTAAHPKTGGEWGQAGAELLRFDGWLKGKRELKWRAELPYQPAAKIKTPGAAVAEATVKSFCTAGDFAFGVESRTATVHVFALADGKKIGEMTPGPEVGRESGWVDFPDALRATKRPGGEYLVFVEEDAKAKVLVYRWTPKP